MSTEPPNRKPLRRQIQIAGWREWVTLGDLGLPPIKAKLDTGARTSALHAVKLKVFQKDDREWIRFVVHPRQRTIEGSVAVETEVLEWRHITSSNGQRQRRPVIVTNISFFGETWPLELTLTNRDNLGFRMLLGREGLRGRLVVDSGRSFIGGRPKRPRRIKRKKRKVVAQRPSTAQPVEAKAKKKARSKAATARTPSTPTPTTPSSKRTRS